MADTLVSKTNAEKRGGSNPLGGTRQLLIQKYFMHPSIRNAYDKSTHPFAKHPVHGVYGKELAHDQFNHIKGQYNQSTGSEQFNPMAMQSLLAATMRREAAHQERLVQLAKDIVSKVWKANPSIFRAELGSPGMEVADEDNVDDSLTPEQLKEVHKRTTLNSLTHGAAIHQMTTLHHMIKDAINKLDPQLMAAYDKLSRGAVYSSWFASIEQIADLGGSKGGDVQVDWDEQGQPSIQATAILFPILVHELAKGCMELLTAHGLPSDEETLKKIYKHADRYEDEVHHFFVGPALWRRFIKVADRERMPEVVAALSKQSPDRVHEIIRAVVENPAQAEEMLRDLIAEPEAFNPEQYGEDIARIADLIAEEPELAEPAVKPETKPAQTPSRPDKTDPYRPPKPAVLPQRKAANPAPAPTKPATTPQSPTPSKPDPYRPTKPAIAPKPKASDE